MPRFFYYFKSYFKNRFMRIILVIVSLLAIVSAHSQVDTIVIRSEAMKKNIRCVVIQPSLQKGELFNGFPVVYLLHGYSGSYNNWIRRVPLLTNYAEQYQVMIVCPDGDYSSWYFDSPVDSSMKYETYISREVPAYIDRHYKTIASARGRAITGLSMGGHGALFLALRHPDVFGACGSMSGGVDLSDLKKKYDVALRLGDTTRHAANWRDYSVINLVEKQRPDSLAIMIDCGLEDFFYQDNRALHEKMLRLKIPHDYTERPGKHNWEYWETSIPHQLVFFSQYFRKKSGQN